NSEHAAVVVKMIVFEVNSRLHDVVPPRNCRRTPGAISHSRTRPRVTPRATLVAWESGANGPLKDRAKLNPQTAIATAGASRFQKRIPMAGSRKKNAPER